MHTSWVSIRCLALAAVTVASTTVTTQGQLAQPAKRVELSSFTKVGAVTDDLWGFDAYYQLSERIGAFGTLTVVDSLGGSGWMVDAGIRLGWLQARKIWKMLYLNLGVGVRVKDLSDGTKVRALTDLRWGLRLGHIVPFFAVRQPWPYLSERGETVWGLAVAIW